MGIQSSKKRKSMLGSVHVSSLEAEKQEIPEVINDSASITHEVENNRIAQPIAAVPLATQQMVSRNEKQNSRMGRKRRELIPGERERNFTIQLPESIINKMKIYGLEHGMSMKDIIGELLMEKFK